jgi:hypothetical protein
MSNDFEAYRRFERFIKQERQRHPNPPLHDTPPKERTRPEHWTKRADGRWGPPGWDWVDDAWVERDSRD